MKILFFNYFFDNMPKYINLLFIKIKKIIYKQINKLYNNNSNEYI